MESIAVSYRPLGEDATRGMMLMERGGLCRQIRPIRKWQPDETLGEKAAESPAIVDAFEQEKVLEREVFRWVF
jgi:hypothetical protein